MDVPIFLIVQLLNLLSWGVIIYVLLGYFLDPYHPIRQFLARIYEPMLMPIRSMMPQTGMIDFSPMVFYLIVQLIRLLIIQLL